MNQKAQKILPKILKILGIGITVIALALILGISSLIWFLPSPADIGKKIGFAPKSNSASPTTTTLPTDTKDQATVASDNPSGTDNVDEQVAEYLMNSDRPLFEICSTLKNASTAKLAPYSTDEFGAELVHNATSENRNPLIESFVPFLRYTLRLSEIDTLLRQTREAYLAGDHGFIKKAQFYSQLVRAKDQIKEHIPQIEKVVDQSYLFFMMAKAVRVRPELAEDPYVAQYCEQVEDSLNQNPAQEFAELKKSFEEFLADNQIAPTEIGYDPKYKTEIESDLGADGLKLSGGWVDSLIASPESTQGRHPQGTDRPF